MRARCGAAAVGRSPAGCCCWAQRATKPPAINRTATWRAIDLAELLDISHLPNLRNDGSKRPDCTLTSNPSQCIAYKLIPTPRDSREAGRGRPLIQRKNLIDFESMSQN